MEIRYINENDDRDEISSVYEESWKSTYKDIVPKAYLDSIPKGQWVTSLNEPKRKTLVLIEHQHIVGTCSFGTFRFSEAGDCGEIISIYFLPGYMGKGYGKILLQRALEELQKAGYKEVFLWVLEENRNARSFYEKMGFKKRDVYLDDNIGGKDLREVQYVYSLKSAT